VDNTAGDFISFFFGVSRMDVDDGGDVGGAGDVGGSGGGDDTTVFGDLFSFLVVDVVVVAAFVVVVVVVVVVAIFDVDLLVVGFGAVASLGVCFCCSFFLGVVVAMVGLTIVDNLVLDRNRPWVLVGQRTTKPKPFWSLIE
jgi:hypothetical protein